MHHHHKGLANEGCDRRDVAHEIVIELVVEHGANDVLHAGHEQRVAVRRGSHDHFGADRAAGARPVLHHEWLAEPLRQPLPDQAREDVGRVAGDEADDDAHRPYWIGLRPSET